MSVAERRLAQDDEPEFVLTDDTFDFLRERIHKQTGIVLSEDKRRMVYGRLVRRLRALKLDSFDAYRDMIEADESGEEVLAMINAITTNLTKFFRETHHFKRLASDVLPAVAASSGGNKRLRIWSAGCSSGEEPYSIAMTVHHALADIAHWDARILATDIDTNMVDTGRNGLYPETSGDGIPETLRSKYTREATKDGSPALQMTEAMRNLIVFKPLNLLGDWPMKGPFDAIFCRNVAIYFDRPTRVRLFDRYADMLAPGGTLFIGHSESLLGISERFELIEKTAYRRVS